MEMLISTVMATYQRPIYVLIVEDDPAMKQIYQRVLAKTNQKYRVTWVSDGSEGSTLMRKRSFDLIISDLVLPGSRSGMDLWLQHCASSEKHIPFLLVSGHNLAALASATDAPTLPPFLTKPFSFPEFHTFLTEQLHFDSWRCPLP